MEVRRLAIADVVELTPKRFGDARGYFSETWSAQRFAEAAPRHVLRGLHFQVAPAAQDKLVRVLRGRIFDVAVDLRAGSPHYGRWVACELSAEQGNQLLVPRGFAHGFLTLEADCEVFYKVSAAYAPAADRSIRFDDPQIGIAWPLDGAEPVLSEKDRKAPRLAEAGPIDFGLDRQ
jgi:dTDP-4-dehydrorhamnose 3,5-epimerase